MGQVHKSRCGFESRCGPESRCVKEKYYYWNILAHKFRPWHNVIDFKGLSQKIEILDMPLNHLLYGFLLYIDGNLSDCKFCH